MLLWEESQRNKSDEVETPRNAKLVEDEVHEEMEDGHGSMKAINQVKIGPQRRVLSLDALCVSVGHQRRHE